MVQSPRSSSSSRPSGLTAGIGTSSPNGTCRFIFGQFIHGDSPNFSTCEGFHKWRYPQMDGLYKWKSIYKWMIWRYPYFRKPLFMISNVLKPMTTQFIAAGPRNAVGTRSSCSNKKRWEFVRESDGQQKPKIITVWGPKIVFRCLICGLTMVYGRCWGFLK